MAIRAGIVRQSEAPEPSGIRLSTLIGPALCKFTMPAQGARSGVGRRCLLSFPLDFLLSLGMHWRTACCPPRPPNQSLPAFFRGREREGSWRGPSPLVQASGQYAREMLSREDTLALESHQNQVANENGQRTAEWVEC